MKTLVAAASLLAFSLAGAKAADLPRRGDAPAPAPFMSPAPVFSWTGLYAGVNGGFAAGGFTRGGDFLFGKGNGGLIGGTLGYNHQFNNLVLGIEGDWGWSGIKGSNNALAGPTFANSKITSLATARLRGGYAIDRALLFVTGGYAGGSVRSTLTDTSLPPGAQTFNTRSWNNGFALGAGVEYAFTKNVSAKLEYLHVNLADKPVFAPPWASTSGARQNIFRAGLNYRF